MDLHLLVDSIVWQTTVSIVRLASSGGPRAPLVQADQTVTFCAGQCFTPENTGEDGHV